MTLVTVLDAGRAIDLHDAGDRKGWRCTPMRNGAHPGLLYGGQVEAKEGKRRQQRKQMTNNTSSFGYELPGANGGESIISKGAVLPSFAKLERGRSRMDSVQ